MTRQKQQQLLRSSRRKNALRMATATATRSTSKHPKKKQSTRRRRKRKCSLWTIVVSIGLGWISCSIFVLYHHVDYERMMNAATFDFDFLDRSLLLSSLRRRITWPPSAGVKAVDTSHQDQAAAVQSASKTTKPPPVAAVKAALPQKQQQAVAKQQSATIPLPLPLPLPPLPPYEYVYKRYFEPVATTPWVDWQKCNATVAFEHNCKPRPANCTNIVEEVMNNHGIGNALIVTYVKAAAESLQAHPNCAPILHDKLLKANSPGMYNFKLLDYVYEPTVVIPLQPEDIPQVKEPTKKCILYSLTKPRPNVATKLQHVHDKFTSAYSQLPLVALHIRSGWSDELQRNAIAWEALGKNCEKDHPFDVMSTPHVTNEIDLQGLVLDTAHAADTIFGVRQWRLYVASDAPTIRTYVQFLLRSRTHAPIVWNDGLVGHNYLGGQITSLEEKVETAVSAFVDVLVMSKADLLVSLSSKFPRSAEMISPCPQRLVHLPGHPRHGLAKTGGLLTKAYHMDQPQLQQQEHDGDTGTKWIPEWSSWDLDMKNQFWEGLPHGRNNSCATTTPHNILRSCYCMLKQGHQRY